MKVRTKHMTNYKLSSAVICCAILLSAYYEVSVACKECSPYLEFSLLGPVVDKKADFHVLAITDQPISCTLDTGDSEESVELSPGLTNRDFKDRLYTAAGIYTATLKCSNIVKYLRVPVESGDKFLTLLTDYNSVDSTIKIQLEIADAKYCPAPTKCNIYDMYFEEQTESSVIVNGLVTDDILLVTGPGFHNVGVKCPCLEILYAEKSVHVWNPIFEENLFPSFLRTSEREPFVIYENSHLLIDVVPKPCKNEDIISREWKVKKKNGASFEAVNWTFSDQATFPVNASFGLYRIELKVSFGKSGHLDTLYLLYKKIIRPLQIHGGAIQFVDPSNRVRLLEDEKGVYYLWCNNTDVPEKDVKKPLWKIDLERKVNCEPFTKNDSVRLPANLMGTNRLVQVFAITETDFREGRSLLKPLTKQKNHVAVNIRCIYNCDGQVSVNTNWVLQLELENSSYLDDAPVTYEWEVKKSKGNNKFKTLKDLFEGADTSALTIMSGSLPTGQWVRVCAKISSASFEGSACNEVYCGLPPRKGKCSLLPLNGTAMETKFTINCTGYEDDGIQEFRPDKNAKPSSAGIQYAVLFKSGDNLAVIYYGIVPVIGPFALGAGYNFTSETKLYIRVYDIYYSFDNLTLGITLTKPRKMSGSLGDIKTYLLNHTSNIDHLPRQDLFNVINSVSGVINKMETRDMLELIKYDVNDMTRGKFIDFEIKANGSDFKTWEEMMFLLKNEEHKSKVQLYSKFVDDFVDKIENFSKNIDDEIDLLSTLGALNLAISYHPYVSERVLAKSVDISRVLLKRALHLCQKPIISVFITDITDCSEILLGRLMSVINTDQIVLAKEGFAWDTVRKYMESDQGYVKQRIIDIAMLESEIDEFERFYILQKTYLQANVGINQKREQAHRLSSNLVGSHLHYIKRLIRTTSVIGRKSKSHTGTSVCAERKRNAVKCGQLGIQIDDDRPRPSENVSQIQILATKENLFTYDKDMRSSLVSQPTLILKMGRNDTKTNRSVVIKFRDAPPKPPPDTPKFVDGDQARLFYHRFVYRSKTDYACIRLSPKTDRSMGVPGYTAYFRLLLPPNNDTFHYRTAFTHANLTDGRYQFCVPPGTFKSNGSLFVGFRPFIPKGFNSTSVDLFTLYSFEAISLNCIIWDGTEWSRESCGAPIWTDQIACQCVTNKQVTVSNTFFVPPNVIDFSSVFTKFDIINNGTVFGVVLGTFLLFIVIFVIALRQDRKEERMGHFRSLTDNYKDDSFYYLLIVYTGLKVGAGTQSNICFLLSGEKATSGVRSLSDEAHKGFKSGSLRKFVLSTPSDLGDLIFLRIWTDCSGIGEESSWFLDRIEVMQVNNNKKFVFRCNAWLTADRNGRAVYLLPCNRFQDEMGFSCRFKENIHKSMTDGHLWFSAYMRPCYGQFTRAQRVTCCALVLYLTMIANAMFYRSVENLVKPNQFILGPLRFSLSQIAISMQSIAITLPPTFLVMIFFKNSRPPKYKHSEEESEVWKGPSEFPGNGFLPHWCVYVGWLLAFSANLASGFFVILYSMQWGKTKSEEWMTTFLLSSGESLFLVDPIKIFLVAFMIAILGKGKQDLKLTYLDNMNIVQEIYNINYKERDEPAKFSIFSPMGRRDRLKRRIQVRNEIWIRSILLNVVMYALLLWSSTGIAFTNRNPHAFIYKDHLKRTFADPPGSAFKFSKINSVTSFYQWTRNIVYPALFPLKNHAEKSLHWIDKKFTDDATNVKIGPMRLRQLRLQNPENCSTYGFMGIRDCYPAYSFSREETSPHCLGWNKFSHCGFGMVYNGTECSPCGNEMVHYETLVAWSYTPAHRISGLPTVGIYNTYGGGGYIMNIQVNNEIANKIQKELIREMWIDRKSRAVFLEFTLYNSNSNQFANFFFLVEFPESGGAIPYYQINVVTAYNSFDPYTVACLVTYGLCFVLFAIKNAYNLLKERAGFFKNFWNLVDLSAFLTSSSALVAYTMQYFGTQAVLEQYREDPRVFVNFYHLVVWNHMITYNLAFQIFFTIIRLSCILGISQRMSEIASVMKLCASELIGVFCIFLIFAIAYTMVGNLAFPITYSYRSYASSLISIYLLLLGKTDFVELINISPIIGKIYFVSKVFFMIFIILKMFEGVLSNSISSKKRTNVHLSLLELFVKRLKTSRMVRMCNAARRENMKEETERN